MKKIFLIATFLVSVFGLTPSVGAVILVDVYRDGYIEDFTRDQNIPPDGVPDRIADTNSLLAARGEAFDEFNAFNYDTHVIMTFNISSYSGLQLSSAYLTGYGTRVDNKGSTDPITGQFYAYSGDGLVGFDDFDAAAFSLGEVAFQDNDPQTFLLDPFQLDIKPSLQAFLNDPTVTYAEFRVESEQKTVFINAGETDPSSGFPIDSNWPGPRLALTFEDNAVVPEPATLLLVGLGLVGSFFHRQLGQSGWRARS